MSARFRVVLVEHGYASTNYEREIISAAGGEFIDAEKLPLSESLRLCETAEAVMVRRLEVPAEIVRRFKQCRLLLRYGVGTDNVDLKAATEAGIIVGHVPVYCSDEVSAHALALLLACIRNIVSASRKLAAGAWDLNRSDRSLRISGKTLGIIGLGNIGQALARKLQGWNLRLLALDPFVTKEKASALGVELVDLETLCRQSDYISIHVPLLPETFHLIGERELGWMKPEAILVNTARGPVVDTAALLRAVDSGKLAQAGLDVFEQEPLPADSPFRSHPRIVVTDHMAWYSEEGQVQLQKTAAEEVVRVCTGGLPMAVANPEVLKKLGRYEEWRPPEGLRWKLAHLGWALPSA